MFFEWYCMSTLLDSIKKGKYYVVISQEHYINNNIFIHNEQKTNSGYGNYYNT